MHTCFSTPDRIQAELVAGRLNAAGVRAEVLAGDSAFGGAVGVVTVVVADQDAERAAAVLSDAVPRPDGDGEGDVEPSTADTASAPLAAAPPTPARAQWLGLGVVLLFAWLQPFVWAVDGLVGGDARKTTLFSMASEIVWGVGICALAWFVVAAGSGDLRRHGFVRPGFLDVLLAFAVLAASLTVDYVLGAAMAANGLQEMLHELYPAATHPGVDFDPSGHGDGALALIFGFVVLYYLVLAAAEEFVFRGYLLPRFAELFGSRVIATFVAAALFASYHCYQGAYWTLWAFWFGLVMSLGFWVTRRVWPLALAHAASNLLLMF